jgi:expansin
MRLPAALGCTLAIGLACSRAPRRAPADAGARCTGDPISAMGVATYYDPDRAAITGRCSFPPIGDAGDGDRFVAALNAPDYAHAAWCGACLAVSGPLGEVVVRVIDRCPGCKHGDLDLSRDAFAEVAPLSAGRVRIAWREVECPVTGPIGYHVKPGSNAQWLAIQLRNHRTPIASLEVRGAAGYQALARSDDNYFAVRGLGAGPYALRATDVRGQVLEDAVALGDATTTGAAQFPSCP